MLMVLLLPVPAFASEANLRAFFVDVQTLQANFDQQVYDENGMSLESSSGVFSLSRPGKFRWDYASNDPELATGQQIIADGEFIMMFDPDLEQLTKRSLDDALAQVPSLLLVQSGTDVDVHFNIIDFGVTDGLSWVGLKPKDENAGYQQLMVGFGDGVLRSITLVDGLGNETRLTLRNVVNNAQLADKVFVFDVPAGVDVLSE